MDQTDDPIFPEAGHVNGTSVVGTTESPGMTEADSPTADQPRHGLDSAGLRPGFLSELASAMRATAERERETIAARVAEDASVHIEKVRSRAAIETEELRRLAEEDVQHIEEWSAAEMDRIRAEADLKIEDRRASLDDYLRQHDAIIDTEIEGVDAAVKGYGETLDTFFAELSEVGDPATIVARAEALPAPPDLDQVRATARSSAVAMFADPDPVADAGSQAVAETDVVAESIATGDQDTTADEMVASSAQAEGESPDVAGFVAPTTDVDATNGSGAPDAIAEAPVAETSPAAPEASAESATAEPVPVMDPAAAANQAWPAPEPATRPEAEPEPVAAAASMDHTSAAVRLLRSVAPWTAPTHAGSDREQPD